MIEAVCLHTRNLVYQNIRSLTDKGIYSNSVHHLLHFGLSETMGDGRGLSGNPFRLGGGIWVSLTEKLLSSCFQHAEPGSNARTLYPVLCTRTTQTMSSCTLPVMSNGLLYGFMGRDRTRIDVTQSSFSASHVI